MQFLDALLDQQGFMPHGHCYLWRTDLVMLQAASDSLIAVAYVAIPVTLLYFMYKRKDLPYVWMFFCFALFIILCGATHVLEVWTLWHPDYWLSGFTKAATAIVSLTTAVLLVRLVPDALALPSPSQFQAANEHLRHNQEALRNSEQQLLHAQRMDAVGQLAGGVAHDFNNLLTAMRGYMHCVVQGLSADDPRLQDAKEVQKTITRATSLTRQLLSFSRNQVSHPRPLNLNEVVGHLEGLLRRLISENIEIDVQLDPNLGPVLADPGQLEQVIVNLVINASDAMPEGGRIVIRTSRTDLNDDAGPSRLNGHAGRNAFLIVTDSGTGMDEETQSRVFEAYFTTKEIGKGTGLGLSTVYGIIQQSGGKIHLSSELGRGTRIAIQLPVAEGDDGLEGQPGPQVVRSSKGNLRGRETVLVVEDDPVLRTLCRRFLKKYGYRVIAAGSPGQAFRLCEESEAPIDLVLSDIILPEMTGPEMVPRLPGSAASARVVYMSGYGNHSLSAPAKAQDSIILEKPFDPITMLATIRQALEGGSTQSRRANPGPRNPGKPPGRDAQQMTSDS